MLHADNRLDMWTRGRERGVRGRGRGGRSVTQPPRRDVARRPSSKQSNAIEATPHQGTFFHQGELHEPPRPRRFEQPPSPLAVVHGDVVLGAQLVAQGVRDDVVLRQLGRGAPPQDRLDRVY